MSVFREKYRYKVSRYLGCILPDPCVQSIVNQILEVTTEAEG